MSEFVNDDHNALRCNNCGELYLHQFQVDIFERSEESDTGIHTRVLSTSTAIDGNMSQNPSDRRNGLMIYCSCEMCDNITVFSIYQHKGMTFLRARSFKYTGGDAIEQHDRE